MIFASKIRGFRTAGRGPDPTTLIVISLLSGSGFGLFFGEYCASVKWIGDSFIGLLQMTVLPYITFSLIANIGRLTPWQGRRLAKIALSLLLVLWAIGIVTVMAMSLALPGWSSGSFFSTSFTETPDKPHLLSMFVPANPFQSLASNFVPAVVVFSIGVGVALMRMERKDLVLEPLEVMVKALSRLNKGVVRLAPIGIFAIMASAVGTLPLAQFGLLQGYVLILTAATLLLTFCLLPMLIAACTPFRYSDVLRESEDTLITAFVVGSSFVVLPLIIESTQRLLERHQLEDSDGVSTPEFVIPLAYPFPDLGRILALFFIPFAAWFYGSHLEWSEYPAVMAVGLLGSFGSLNNTIPMLLDIAQIPSDIFQLYMAVGVYTGRLADILKAMHLLTFTTATTCIMAGAFRIRWRRVAVSLTATLLIGCASFLGIYLLLGLTFKDAYNKEEMIVSRHMLLEQAPSVVFIKAEPNPDPRLPGESFVERIRRRGAVRVGYHPNKLPFSYFNIHGDLVGFDIEMAHRLARDLDVRVEFVPFEDQTIDQQFAADHFEVAMSGLEGTIQRAAAGTFADSYMDVTLAVVVHDFRKREFRELKKIQHRGDLKIAVVKKGFFAEAVTEYFPNAEVVELETEEEYFDHAAQEVDALLTSAETGSAWTLLHPGFAVVNPMDEPVRIPLYYFGTPDIGFEQFLEVWLALNEKNGTIDELYSHWILGRDGNGNSNHWSIIRNVLHWVN